MRKRTCAFVLASLFVAAPALALDWDLEGFHIDLKNRASAGIAWRMQDRNPALIGKLNVDGQQHLCDADDCLSLQGDPAPVRRLIAAQGSFNGENHDDGDLNYDKHDITAAVARLTTDLKVTWGDLLVRVRGIGYFDPINTNFDDVHPNTEYQPATTPRTGGVERVYAKGAQLMEAYAQYAFTLGERTGSISVGQQTVRWGESGLFALNSVSEINPPSSVRYHTPGAEIGELFQPVPLVVASMDLFPGAGIEGIYQFGWRPVEVDPKGSFQADVDAFGNNGGEPIYINLGQFPEDPNCIKQVRNNLLKLLSSSCDTARLLPLDQGYPRNGGQYGLKLNYFADSLGNGTEFDLYYLHYHSRLPYLSIYAAEESCARTAPTGLQAAINCRGFKGTIGPLPPNPVGIDPLNVNTIKLLVDYPENIDMFGFSFNTNIGSWSLAGEYSFRPNVPMQIQVNDLAFAALQPTFPNVDQNVGTDAIPGLGPILASLGIQEDFIRFPSARHAVPDYVETLYRGHSHIDANGNLISDVYGGQFIPGYERMKVGQFDFTALQAFSNVPLIGADQLIFIGEVGGTQVFGMPSIDKLQFEGGGQGQSNHSAGADGTGQPGPDGVDTTGLSFNTTKMNSGFADSFAWGVRVLMRGEYNDVVYGWTFMPIVIGGWDVKGIAPYPIQNFVEGRHDLIAGTEIKFTQNLTATVLYQWFLGGGQDNTRLDRDNLSMALAYTF
jgi:hypothetical protein